MGDEIAEQMAKRCKEMRAERAFCPVKCFDAAGRSHFSVHQGSGLIARNPRRKDLKVFRLPASLLLICTQTDPDYLAPIQGPHPKDVT
ncbi:MAG: hypothetical protein NXI17_07745 [Alphaproteobacteria bacterium]|nr:hypothetical protein [Alphaproteobacteria bacterium]